MTSSAKQRVVEEDGVVDFRHSRWVFLMTCISGPVLYDMYFVTFALQTSCFAEMHFIESLKRVSVEPHIMTVYMNTHALMSKNCVTKQKGIWILLNMQIRLL